MYKSFTKQVSTAVKKRGIIKLPDGTITKLKTTLKDLRASKESFPGEDIKVIVSLLDEQDGSCGRLETKLFGTILEVLLQTAYSQWKERGLLLLVNSLYNNRGEDNKTETRVIALGKDNIRLLLISFGDATEQARTRRWIGLLLQRLLYKSDENIYIFESCPENLKRKLGTMVTEEKDEILRIVSGQILKVLMDAGIPPKNLWPVDADPVMYTNFPSSTQSKSSWNQDFQSYVDGLFEMRHVPEDTGNLYFAHKVVALPSEFLTYGRNSVMVLIDDGVSICASFSDDHFGGSLDFPFDLIRDVFLQEIIFDSGKRLAVTPYDVLITLRVDEEAVCCINGKPLMVTEIRLSVRDQQQAVTIMKDLLSMRSVSKTSQAQDPIDIGIFAPPEDTSLSQGSKSSISSKASRATNNIMIPARNLSTYPQSNDTQNTQSRVCETPRRTSFQRGKNRVSDLIPEDDGPIFTPREKNSGAVQDDASDESLTDLEVPYITRPGQATVDCTETEPIHFGPSSERRNEESTDDPISFLPKKLDERQAARNPPNISKDTRPKTRRTALIPRASIQVPQSKRRITSSVSSDIMTGPCEQNTFTPRRVVQTQTVKSQPKPNISTRVELSLEGPRTAEANLSRAKTKALKKVKKYSLNYKPTATAVPVLLSKTVPVCQQKISNATNAVIWDLPADSAENKNAKGRTMAKVEAVSETKTDIRMGRRIDTVINKKASTRRKNGTTAKKQSAPAVMPQPGPSLRSTRKAAQAANSKLQKAVADEDDVKDNTTSLMRDDAPRCNNKEVSRRKKVAGGVRKQRVKRIVRMAEQQIEAKSKCEIDNSKMPRIPWGATERDVGTPPALPLFDPENLEVISPPSNIEEQFQLHNQGDMALILADDNSGPLDDGAASMPLNPLEINGKYNDGALRLAQRLSSLLEGMDDAGQPGAIDKQRNLTGKQTHSPIGSDNGPESSILADPLGLGISEGGANGILTTPKCGSRERSPVSVENCDIVFEKNQLRKDLKSPFEGVDATHLYSHEAKPTVSRIFEFADDCGSPNSASVLEQQVQKTSANKQDTAGKMQETGASRDLPPIPALPHTKFHTQNYSPSRNGISPSRSSTIRHKGLSPQETQTPPRRSPRLLEREKRAAIIPEILLTDKYNSNATLVNEHLARKTPLVGFGIIGARNQGYSSNKKSSIAQIRVPRELPPLPELVKEIEEPQQRKRGRAGSDRPNKIEEKQPKFKIQKICQVFPSDTKAPGNSNQAQDCFQTGGPLFAQIPVSGSQSSRVDHNGSPRALNSSTNIDRYLRLRGITRKLVVDSPQKETNAFNDLTTGTDFVGDRQAFSEDETVLVPSNSKPRPLSPLAEGEGINRCILHKKETTSGDYIRAAARVAVPTKQITADPFLKKDAGRKLSEFTLRLQAERSRRISNFPRGTINAKGSEYVDPEKTLVDEYQGEESSPPRDISSGISDGSQYSRQLSSRTDIGINDRALIEWERALKPHYKGMRDTLIRIVDDIVRDLIDQESAIDSALEDYHRGGLKLVGDLKSKQKNHALRAEDELSMVMAKMTILFKESQGEILQGVKKTKVSSVDQMERGWKQQQQLLQTLIEEKRKQIKQG